MYKSRQERVSKKFKMIRYYGTLIGTTKKLIIMIDTDYPEVLARLSHNSGSDWRLETYLSHEVHEVRERDSIIAG